MGNNGNGSKGNICPDCQGKLTPIKLYAPEILKVFSEGRKDYSKNGILTNFATCLSPHCRVGNSNLMNYQKIVDDGMIRVE